jgi:uncharacterized membrane protein YedE/YeeE
MNALDYPGPAWSPYGLRAAVGFGGGLLMALGARLAGGCTSGHGISGTMQLSPGSWIYAELSGWSKRTVESWGDIGKVMLPDLLHIPRSIFVPGLALLLDLQLPHDVSRWGALD